MKIAVVGAKGLPAKQGGVEHHCEEIYPRLVSQGHSVDLYARSFYTGVSHIEKYDVNGVRVISLPCWNPIVGMDAFLSSALGAQAACGTKYDIIHFHALGPSLFTWLPKLASTAKIVVTCHGLDWQRAKWSKLSSQLIRYGERAAVRFADELIVVSQELQSYFKQTYNRETTYIPNAASDLGASDPKFGYGKQLGLTPGRYILFLGRLVPEKCPDLLIQAFKKLQPEGWKLVLVGGTSETADYTNQLLEMGKDDPNVIFTDQLSGSPLAEIIRGAGLFVLPSELEGLPLAMLEAMQEGIPVVASDIPVHQQLLGKDRGVLFQTSHLDACVESLNWAIHHPDELAIMAKKAKNYVQTHHHWDRISQETLRVYTRLVTSYKTSDLALSAQAGAVTGDS